MLKISTLKKKLKKYKITDKKKWNVQIIIFETAAENKWIWSEKKWAD